MRYHLRQAFYRVRQLLLRVQPGHLQPRLLCRILKPRCEKLTKRQFHRLWT
jgi:hypothetical protein